MGKVMILNGSPRAPKSNSKIYSDIFRKYCKLDTEYFNISKTNHKDLCEKIGEFSDVLVVFPLYADSLPVTLLNFLKNLELNPPEKKPVISLLVNCGFIEYQQNDIAVKMMEQFCKKNEYKMGSVLKIGSGEAILTTVFNVLVKMKIRRLAYSVANKKYKTFTLTMPLSKRSFIKASTKYWDNYGKNNGVTHEEMDTMNIES